MQQQHLAAAVEESRFPWRALSPAVRNVPCVFRCCSDRCRLTLVVNVKS